MIKKMQFRLSYVAILFLFFSSHLNAKINDTRDYIAKNPAQSRYVMFDSSHKKPVFKNGIVKWYYNSMDYSGFSEFDKLEIIKIIKKAMSSWSKHGDIEFVYQGETLNRISDTDDDIVTIGYLNNNDFNDVCGEGYTGCASSLWSFDKKIYDGFVALNPKYYYRMNKIEVQGLLTHEIGHLLGINHSNSESSIMYAKPYHSNSYQSILRQDDIEAINSIYPYSTRWATGAYENEANVSKRLSIKNARSLKVKVVGETEQNYDYISFFDSNGKKLKSFSGSINEEFVVKDSHIKAVLISDESINKSGVEVSISAF